MIKGDKVCIDKIKELQMKDREKTISAAEKEMMTTLEVCHEVYSARLRIRADGHLHLGRNWISL